MVSNELLGCGRTADNVPSRSDMTVASYLTDHEGNIAYMRYIRAQCRSCFETQTFQPETLVTERMKRRAGDGRTIHTYKHTYTSRTTFPSMWGSLRLAPTSDMQGMVWGEPERGSAQNGIWKCDGDDSSHGHWQYQFSLHS